MGALFKSVHIPEKCTLILTILLNQTLLNWATTVDRWDLDRHVNRNDIITLGNLKLFTDLWMTAINIFTGFRWISFLPSTVLRTIYSLLIWVTINNSMKMYWISHIDIPNLFPDSLKWFSGDSFTAMNWVLDLREKNQSLLLSFLSLCYSIISFPFVSLSHWLFHRARRLKNKFFFYLRYLKLNKEYYVIVTFLICFLRSRDQWHDIVLTNTVKRLLLLNKLDFVSMFRKVVSKQPRESKTLEFSTSYHMSSVEQTHCTTHSQNSLNGQTRIHVL